MSPTMYVMRGVSGSGKSTHAASLGAIVYSPDEFFDWESGNYRRDQQERAHAWNLRRVLDHMQDGWGSLVVDAVNAQPWEWQRYTEPARARGCCVEFVQMHPLELADVSAYVERNIHGVTASDIVRQLERMQASGVDFWGSSPVRAQGGV